MNSIKKPKIYYFGVVLLSIFSMLMLVDAYQATKFDAYASLWAIIIDVPLGVALISLVLITKRRERESNFLKSIILVTSFLLGLLLLVWRIVLIGFA